MSIQNLVYYINSYNTAEKYLHRWIWMILTACQLVRELHLYPASLFKSVLQIEILDITNTNDLHSFMISSMPI